MLRGRARLFGLTRRAEDVPKLRALGRRADRGRPRHVSHAAPAALPPVRRLALRAAAFRRPRRSAHAEVDCSAFAGADYTAAPRLHFHSRRVRRLRRIAHRRDAPAPRADAAGQAPRGGRGSAARVGRAARHAGHDPARAGHLFRDAAAARPHPAGHAGARRRRRCLHQSHPRRRPRAGRGGGHLPRPSESRVQRRPTMRR